MLVEAVEVPERADAPGVAQRGVQRVGHARADGRGRGALARRQAPRHARALRAAAALRNRTIQPTKQPSVTNKYLETGYQL